MAFNSFLFFGFFALTGLLFGFVRRDYRWILLLAASMVFVVYSSHVGVLYLLASALVTYGCTMGIERLRNRGDDGQGKKAAWLLAFDVVFNLGILFMTKYLNFFGAVLSDAVGVEYKPVSLAVPIGISFYTFMIIGYAVDVYRKEYPPQKNFAKLLLFAAYFPQLVDGPISRYDDIQESLYHPRDIAYERCRDGLMLFAWGLFKKLCVADNLILYVNLVFENHENYHGLVIFSGAAAYAIYIYADFSGCIDMARGVSQYFGIGLRDNFNHPYFAVSVEDFWRRWHMTLSSWFKDYLFYPILRSKPMMKMAKGMKLGGYRKLSRILPTSLALLVVWTFTGLWHGAKGTYILWGLYYGLILIAANIVNTLKKGTSEIKWKPLHILTTFLIVCFGYMIFNAESTEAVFAMLGNTFSAPILDIGALKTLGIQYYKRVGAAVYFAIAVASTVLFIVVDFLQYKKVDLHGFLLSGNRVVKYLLFAAFVFFLFLMMNRTSGDFTYMQF